MPDKGFEEKSEIMKESLPDIIAAINLNELPKVIEKKGTLHDGTVVATIEGTDENRKTRELGFDITEKKV